MTPSSEPEPMTPDVVSAHIAAGGDAAADPGPPEVLAAEPVLAAESGLAAEPGLPVSPAEPLLPDSPAVESLAMDLPGQGGAGDSPGHSPGRERRGTGLTMLITLVVLGLVAVAGGGMMLAIELTRQPTKAELAAAVAKEIASRWQRLPAGKIFPAVLGYQNAQGDHATAVLAGIGPAVPCRAALAPSSWRQIRGLGCTAMLRATYVDPSGTLAATVAIGAMTSAASAAVAQSDLTPMQPTAGLYALSFRGTLTGKFSNADRAMSGALFDGPYIFAYTVGYTDGMPGAAARSNPELAALGTGLLGPLEKIMTSHGAPCAMKDIRC